MTDAGSTGVDADTHAALDAVERDWARAIVSNDADRIAEFMTDDWVIVSGSGVMTAEQFLSFVRSGELTHCAMDPVGGSRGPTPRHYRGPHRAGDQHRWLWRPTDPRR
jgi:hypothetical protein